MTNLGKKRILEKFENEKKKFELKKKIQKLIEENKIKKKNYLKESLKFTNKKNLEKNKKNIFLEKKKILKNSEKFENYIENNNYSKFKKSHEKKIDLNLKKNLNKKILKEILEDLDFMENDAKIIYKYFEKKKIRVKKI